MLFACDFYTRTHTCADFSPGSWLPGWVLALLSLDVHTEKTFCPESRTASPSPKAASRQTEKHCRALLLTESWNNWTAVQKWAKKQKKTLGKCYKTVFYILKIYFRMSKLRKCAILRKISAHFELLAAMHLKKIGQGLVHHCVTSCPLLKTFWAIYFSCFSPLTQNVVAWGEAQLSTERSEPPFNPNAVSHWVKTVTFQTRKPNKGVRRQWNVHKSWS